MSVKLKPLDLANLIRHAFMAGAGFDGDRIPEDVMRRHMEYDPTDLPCYQRLEALRSEHWAKRMGKSEEDRSPFSRVKLNYDPMSEEAEEELPHTVLDYTDPSGKTVILAKDEAEDYHLSIDGKMVFNEREARLTSALERFTVNVEGREMAPSLKLALMTIWEHIMSIPIPPRIPAYSRVTVSLEAGFDSRPEGFDPRGLSVIRVATGKLPAEEI